MRKLLFFVSILMFAGKFLSCQSGNEDKDTRVLIKTNYGDITVELYDKTVEHKKNFLKLVEEDFYDSLLFHRVIENFMIQGGDPESKNTDLQKRLGEGMPDYSVPAEFFPEYYHKRGALAAARRSDMVNPDKRSSASQFYIVQGETYTEGELDTLLMLKNDGLKKRIFHLEVEKHSDELDELSQKKDEEGFKQKLIDIRLKTDSLYDTVEKYELTEEQRKTYTTSGGYPSLDGDYTVFGEVVDGMDVVDKIAAVETGAANRPVENVIIYEMEVVE